ncbi:hypothetical protein ACHAXA_011323 [Cyclostephanos tholiformis]|uniref:Uncharacterized protein n=1 Tax=Cyclostephanos tholiformis TaxID=382380 RepID=A0ABD3RA75_9STRA
MQERAPPVDQPGVNRAASSLAGCDEEVGTANHLGSDATTTMTTTMRSPNQTSWRTAPDVIYLSLFSILGYTLRVYVGRFFGGDCESNATGLDSIIHDFLWPISSRVCVTSNGRSMQHGGALFIDMPANMLGCLIMGYFVGYPSKDRDDYPDWLALPCLSHGHSLQLDGSLHLGIKTGLCGSLTTYSSWNTQMVLMMDGTANPYLGSQIFASLFGYVLGYQASSVSYRVGRTLGTWSSPDKRGNPHVLDIAPTSSCERKFRSRCHHDHHLRWITPMLLFVIVGTLIGLYVAGDAYWGIPYYRELWIGSLFAPTGTLLRYRLSALNSRLGIRGEYWFPAGTLLANLLGCIISAAITAWIIARSSTDEEGGAQQSWMIQILNAISLGVAGCLSTVSTYVKECVELGEKYPPYDKKQFVYSHGTVLCCCLFGLMVYSPIVRFA